MVGGIRRGRRRSRRRSSPASSRKCVVLSRPSSSCVELGLAWIRGTAMSVYYGYVGGKVGRSEGRARGANLRVSAWLHGLLSCTTRANLSVQRSTGSSRARSLARPSSCRATEGLSERNRRLTVHHPLLRHVRSLRYLSAAVPSAAVESAGLRSDGRRGPRLRGLPFCAGEQGSGREGDGARKRGV